MNAQDDKLKQLFEEYNRAQLIEKLSQSEIIRIKELLPKMEVVLREHDILKTIVKSIGVSIPILLALWQIIERVYK